MGILSGILITLALVALFIGLPIVAIRFWIKMIMDCIRRPFVKEDEKLIWVIVVSWFNILGSLVYYFAVKQNPERWGGK